MKERLVVCLGLFAVMALSNAIVPVLPSYASGTTIQSAIYSAYFLGAFALTLPAGMMADRYGRVIVMQTGLAVSVFSGILVILSSDPLSVIAARFIEGTGAGLYVASCLAYGNSLTDHETMSGYLMASLNAGLLSGLLIAGFLAIHSPVGSVGIIVFTSLCFLSTLLSITISERTLPKQDLNTRIILANLIGKYRWLWYSSIVIIGTTGVIMSLYPDFPGVTPDLAGLWIASMSLATIIAALASARLKLPPIPVIRTAALVMAPGVIVSYFTPLGFLIVGAVAGVVMIAQMAYLAGVSDSQGAAMGLFSTTSYFGMSLLPFLAGCLAERTTVFLAFCSIACVASSVALTIGRSPCRIRT